MIYSWLGPKSHSRSFALKALASYQNIVSEQPARTGILKMTSTKDVINHHLKAFGEHDLKGVLSDYAPGVVFFTQNGPLKGVDAIRPLFQALIAEFGKPGATFTMKQQFVEGDYGYILWSAETSDNV